MPFAIVGDQSEWGVYATVNFEGDGPLETNLITGESFAHFLIERGVVGFPNALACSNSRKINIAATETHHGFAGLGFDLVDSPAFFTCGGFAVVEDEAIAGFSRLEQLGVHGFALHAGDLSEIDAAFSAKAAVGEFLIVDAVEPAGVKATRKTHLEFVSRFLGFKFWDGFAGQLGHHFIKRASIGARDAGDVFGCLQPAFDLQRRYTGAHEIGQHFESR